MQIPEHSDPFDLFHSWLEQAIADEGRENATAMSLSTVDENGNPDSRMVLLKEADSAGFVFYTNLESNKGHQLKAHPYAALCFHWKGLARQIRVKGPVEPVSSDEADAYFASRARESRIGAWASKQSQMLADQSILETRISEFTEKWAGDDEIPRPKFWSGFRLNPGRIEFWMDRPFRLHERLVFRRSSPADLWQTERLFP